MALPTLPNVYCADFVGDSPYWFSDSGEFERINTPYGCGRGWVIVHNNDWQILLEAVDGPKLDFYADSTALFYLGLTAVVTLWAMKALVLKLIYAS